MADNTNEKRIVDNFDSNIIKNNSNRKSKKNLRINSKSKDNTNETPKQKVLFINKKRGRKIKELNYINIGCSHDRYSDDNLKRKIKTHFHNYIISLLNSKLGFGNEMKFVKMDHNMSKDITIEFNLDLCKKQIKEIVKKVCSKFHKKNINEEIINNVMANKDTYYEVVNILNMTYQDLYLNYYLKSTKRNFKEHPEESFESHKEKLKNKFGEEYVKRYVKNAKNLINFFQTCKGRIRRKKEMNNSSFKESTALATTETFQNNNQNSYYFYDEDISYKFKDSNNNKIDNYTQTNRIETDDESEF